MRILAAILILALALIATQAKATFMKQRSLYERLGGQQAIIAVVDDFVADKHINRFFANTDMPRLKRPSSKFASAPAGLANAKAAAWGWHTEVLESVISTSMSSLRIWVRRRTNSKCPSRTQTMRKGIVKL